MGPTVHNVPHLQYGMTTLLDAINNKLIVKLNFTISALT